MTPLRAYVVLVFVWWRHELITLLPYALRYRLARPFGLLKASIVNDRLVIEPGNRRPRERLDIDLNDLGMTDIASRTHAKLRVMRRLSPLVIDPGQENTLTRRLCLPAPALDNLHEVVGFELARQTPFRSDAIVYNWRIHRVEPWAGRIEIVAAAAPKRAVTDVQNALERLGETDVPILIADRPIQADDAATQALRRVAGGLFALALLLTATCVYLPLQQKAARLADLERALASARDEAALARDTRAEIHRLALREDVLVERKQARRSTSQTMAALRHHLPDDVRLVELSISGAGVTVVGRAPAPLNVIEQLEAATIFAGVRFLSPVVDTANGTAKRFQLTARVVDR